MGHLCANLTTEHGGCTASPVGVTAIVMFQITGVTQSDLGVIRFRYFLGTAVM